MMRKLVPFTIGKQKQDDNNLLFPNITKQTNKQLNIFFEWRKKDESLEMLKLFIIVDYKMNLNNFLLLHSPTDNHYSL